MNINEVKNSNLGNERQKEINILCDLLKKNGNCAMNGYLGCNKIDFSFDNLGILEFFTRNETADSITESKGAVFNNNVLIKQVQKKENKNLNQLITWDVNENSYTYVAFDNFESLTQCYERIKEANINLCHEDVDVKFTELGISFDNVAQVLLGQKVDPLSAMLDDKISDVPNRTSLYF